MQESHSAKTAGIAIGAVMLVVGGLAGFGITKAADHNNNKTTSSSVAAGSSAKAVGLKTALVELGLEHMTLTDQAVDAALDGSANASATGAALYSNGTDIGAAVGSVYGKDAETTFNTVWKLHLDEFVKYAVADKTGDDAGKAAALNAIDTQYTKPLAQYLAKANPNLPEATLETVLRQHVTMTAQMIDDHVKGDYAAEAKDLSAANDHIVTIFTTLADGIVKQYPNKF